jgi:hypothetical protein
MIGINIRGVRHLYRVADTSLRDALIFFREGMGYQFCKVIKADTSSILFGGSERLFIFNNFLNSSGCNIGSLLNSKLFEPQEANMIANKFSKVLMFKDDDRRMNDYPHIGEIILLPPTFEKDYNDFLSSNAKMIRTLTNKYGYSTQDQVSMRIYMYTEGSKNFYMWAINTYFQNSTSLSTIKRIMSWNESYGQLIKKLGKNTITAYTSGHDILILSEEISNLRKEKRVNDVINSFNTAQKKLLKSIELNDKDKSTLAKFYRLSEAKKVNFIRKMSTIDNFDELMRQMRHITSTHFEWSKESFMDFLGNVEGISYEIVFEDSDVVLLKVADYETIKHLAKTTNWCISKNKTYWNQYVEQQSDTTQYMIFDFSKKEDDLLSIIGFTTKYNRGITHAHDFANNDMVKQASQNERVFLNSFISQYKAGNGIYKVLDNCGIDITLVAQYDKSLYEWNKEAMYKYLYECVKKDNVDILHDEGNLVALSVVDRNLRYFLGDTYIDAIGENHWPLQHIIFMDFSMSQYDPNKIQFGIIVGNDGNGKSEEAYCIGMFNEHCQNPGIDFNTKLAQFNLPYDIIRRSDNPYDRIKNAFLSFNTPMLNDAIKSKDMLTETIYDYIGEDTAADFIISSVVESMSFDYLDLFYSRGMKIYETLGVGTASSLLKNIFTTLFNNGRSRVMGGEFKKPTEEEINAFFENKLDSLEKTMYVGSYLAIIKIIEHEGGRGYDTNNIYKKMLTSILMYHKSGEVFDAIMEKLATVLDFTNRHDACSTWVIFAYQYGGDRLKSLLKEITEKNEAAMQTLNHLESKLRSVEDEPRLVRITTSHRFEDATLENARIDPFGGIPAYQAAGVAATVDEGNGIGPA